jgi:RNA recognition motif-containing protein
MSGPNTKNWADEDESSGDESPKANRRNAENRDRLPQGSAPSNLQQDREKLNAPRESADIPTSGPFVAYVGNLPYAVTDNMVGNFFDQGGCDVQDVIIKLDSDGRPRGFALVEFKNRESLVTALGADGENLSGRNIKVDVDVKRNKSSSGRSGGGDRGGPEISWDRAPKRDNDSNPPRPDSSRRSNDRDRGDGDRRGGDRDRGGNRGDRDRDGPSRDVEPPLPNAVRKKIVIAPRSIPVEGAAAPAAKVFLDLLCIFSHAFFRTILCVLRAHIESRFCNQHVVILLN